MNEKISGETQSGCRNESATGFWGAGLGSPGLTLRAAAGRGGPQPGTQRAAASGLRAAPALQLKGDAPSGSLCLEA